MPDDIKKFESGLLEYLKSSKLEKERLRSFTATIVKLKSAGFILERIWKYGQPPVIDGIVVRGRIGIKDAAKLNVIADGEKFRWCDIFPIGIPFPDFLEFRAKFGEEVEQFETFR